MAAANGVIREEFVLDCCVVMAWFFVDERNDYAEEIFAAMPVCLAHIPQHWSLEIGNTLRVGERRGRCTEGQSALFLDDLKIHRILLDTETSAHALAETLSLARRFGLATYDAAYLELARRLACPLATIDQKLRQAAALAGVALFQPPKPSL